MSCLVIAEHNNSDLNAATLNTITAAAEISSDVVMLVAGHGCDTVAAQASVITGVSKVIIVDDALLEHLTAESITKVVMDVASGHHHILCAATTFGKNFLPRVAALLNVAQISDITAVVSEDTFVRPIYAGNAIATVKSMDAVKVISVRSTGFDAAIHCSDAVAIESHNVEIGATTSKFVKQELTASERPELTAAKIIISGGRGMQSGDNFHLLESIADKLGAAIGASRAAVDAGFVPNDYQVGQTGKIVAPDLYIAVGISGAIQHLAGMKDSKVIVAINKDEEAPIFQVADYGLVADLFEALPELDAALS